jgi:transcriptional regulator with XRE-family HTH domain
MSEQVQQIAAEMQRRGLTISEVARAAGFSRPHLSRVLAGHESPTIDRLARLATAVGLTISVDRQKS